MFQPTFQDCRKSSFFFPLFLSESDGKIGFMFVCLVQGQIQNTVNLVYHKELKQVKTANLNPSRKKKSDDSDRQSLLFMLYLVR